MSVANKVKLTNNEFKHGMPVVKSFLIVEAFSQSLSKNNIH